jgi:hypothetical protein
MNGLEVENFPANLELNELGATLIARNILFLKIFQLPRSRWNALKDRIVNVQVEHSDINSTMDSVIDTVRQRIINVPIDNDCVENTETNELPRSWENAGIIPVKLKRKLSFKNNVLASYIDPKKLIEALLYIKSQGHPGYTDIHINLDRLYQTSSDNFAPEIENSETHLEEEVDPSVENSEENMNPTML